MGKRRNKSMVELAAAVMRDVREGRAKLAAMGDYVAVEPVKLRSHEPCNYDDCQWPGQCDGRHCLEAGGAVRLTPEEMQERGAPMQSNVELLAQAMTFRVLADAPESKGPFILECDHWVSPTDGAAIMEAWTHAFKKAGREPPPPLLVLGAGFRLRSAEADAHVALACGACGTAYIATVPAEALQNEQTRAQCAALALPLCEACEGKPAKPQTRDGAMDAAVDALAKVLQTHPYTDEAGRIALANTIGAAVLARLATKR
jgi:hypothetical protein